MKAHNMQLKTVTFRLLNKFQMTKFITHIHKHATMGCLVPMTILAVVIVPVFVAMSTATTKGGDHQEEWNPTFHFNFVG